MDDLEKLLSRMSIKDQTRVLEIMRLLKLGQTNNIKIQKLKNSALFRVRVGRYRVIFTINQETKTIKIEDVRLRNESTYK